MKLANYKPIVRRYMVFALIFVLIGTAVIFKAGHTIFVKGPFWDSVAQRYVRDSVLVKPQRGSIYSADGQLLATAVPEFKIYMDYEVRDKDSLSQVRGQQLRDSLFRECVDSLAEGLHNVLPERSAAWFRNRLLEGKNAKKGRRHWLVYPYRISYIDYKAVKELPFFNRGRIVSGFHEESFHDTKKPFGSLASRTLGDMYPGKDSARSGLQLAYDTLLRGQPGVSSRQKVLNKYLNIENFSPVAGADIVTTIDTRMQDYAEKALVSKLKEVDGVHGVVLLMEVATGDVKAIVNMSRCSDGQYREVKNTAVSNLMEPGSVFKPMSFTVAFNDGKIKMSDCVDCCHGVKIIHNRPMKDHNWHRGGYGTLSISECLEQSSNVGVSSVIEKHYGSDPAKFVDGIYKLGIAEDLHLDIPGYAVPNIRRPKADKSNWSKTALPWMSIGYETQVPPISVLNFYNGIANNGRMMRPRFVTCAMRDGAVIREYPPVVIREQMCSPEALRNIQTCLRNVVGRGLGKRAGSPYFHVSGKTGTAQVWSKGGFSRDYLVSFAGYFPSESPKYSCIVCIIKHGLPASGGMQCGPVFRAVAEMAMRATIKPELASAVDSMHEHRPFVGCGNLAASREVLDVLNQRSSWEGSEPDTAPHVWGRAVTTNHGVVLKQQSIADNIVPSVVGVGARDAINMLERLGLNVTISGFGVVLRQSLKAGHMFKPGEKIHLVLGLKDRSKGVMADVEPEYDE